MARRALVVATIFVLAWTWSEAARAADHVVAGKQLTVGKQGSRGSLTLVLRDPSIPIPAPGSADDPSQAGMVVTLFGRVSSEQAALVAAPGLGRPGWKVRTTPRVLYAYASPKSTTGLASVTLRAGTGLTVRAKTPGLALAAPAAAIAVRVEMGETRVCALFDGAAVRTDRVGRFVARNADAADFADCSDETLAALTCEQTLSCGGTCPGDAVCAGHPSGLGGCICVSPHQPCGGTAPACNGECAAGEECSNLGGVLATTCGCLPAGSTPCGGVYPSCGDGDCPAGKTCLVEPVPGGAPAAWCACYSEPPPPPPCPGGCPPSWTCTPTLPLGEHICLPPTCGDSPGEPVCDGACSQPGTECTEISGGCFCLTPCSGPFPTCGGSCPDGFSCTGIAGSCWCGP